MLNLALRWWCGLVGHQWEPVNVSPWGTATLQCSRCCSVRLQVLRDLWRG